MIKPSGETLGVKEMWLPLAITMVGAAIVVASVPGQGKSGLTALGMSFAILGMVVGRRKRRSKISDKEPSDNRGH